MMTDQKVARITVRDHVRHTVGFVFTALQKNAPVALAASKSMPRPAFVRRARNNTAQKQLNSFRGDRPHCAAPSSKEPA